MPTKLEKGIVTLFSDFTVCEKGNILTPEQAKILKLVTRPIAEFKIHIECSFTKEFGFEILKKRANSKKKPMKAKDKKKLKQSKAKKSSDSGDDEATEAEASSFMEIVENSDEDMSSDEIDSDD